MSYFEKRDKFNRERDKYYRQKSNLRLKYAAFGAIGVSTLFMVAIIVWMDDLTDTEYLFMRGCAGVFALIFVVLVAVLVYRVNVAYFADKAKRKGKI